MEIRLRDLRIGEPFTLMCSFDFEIYVKGAYIPQFSSYECVRLYDRHFYRYLNGDTLVIVRK